MIVFGLIFLCWSYMYFLVATGNGFMSYMFQEMDHKDGSFLMSGKVKPNKMVGFPTFFTKILYTLHNWHGKLTVWIPWMWLIKRPFYIIAMKSAMISYIDLICKFIYIGFSLTVIQMISVDHEWIALFCLIIFVVILFLLPSSVVVWGDKRNKNVFNQSNFYHYLLLTDSSGFWTQFISPKFRNKSMFHFTKDKYKEKRITEYGNGKYVRDRSIFKYETFKYFMIKPEESFHPLYQIGYAVNRRFPSKTSKSGGRTTYNSVQFVKIAGRTFVKSGGMMTLLDSKDVIPNDLTLRKQDHYKAFNLRRKSKVPGLIESSKNIFDRTHLVHHRLSGMEGGFGTLVSMYKPVNTGINSLFHGRIVNKPHRRSMKHYEDIALNHLNRFKNAKLLYFAEPLYKENENIPFAVKIQIYHVQKGNTYLIKQKMVINKPYLFRKDKDYEIDVNMVTGETHVRKR